MLACGLGLLSGKLFDMGYFYAIQISGVALYIVWCLFLSEFQLGFAHSLLFNSLFMLSLAKQDQFYQVPSSRRIYH